MKKVIYILFALLFSLAGCNKVLDVSPVDSVDADKAIKDKTGVERAIIGSYNALQAVGLYGRNMMIVGLYEYQYLSFSRIPDPRRFFLGTTRVEHDFFACGALDGGRFDALCAAAHALCGAHAVDTTRVRLPDAAD